MGLSKKFIILSIDGGGIRGIIPSLILTKIEEILGESITKHVDLFAGTSTGCMIVSVMNIPGENGNPKYTAKDTQPIYLEEGAGTFSGSIWKNLTSVYGLYGARYSSKFRDERFKAWLGDTKLNETIKPILLTSYDLVKKEAKVFISQDYTIRGVLSGCTSAPTVFEPTKLDGMLLIDALYAKNPSLIAVMEAIRSFDTRLEDILVLSIGTGYEIVDPTKKTAPPTSGMAFLASICDSMINTHTSTHVITSTLLPKGNALRLDFPVPVEHMDFTDVSKVNIAFLVEATNEYIASNLEVITEFVQKMKKNPQTCPSYIG